MGWGQSGAGRAEANSHLCPWQCPRGAALSPGEGRTEFAALSPPRAELPNLRDSGFVPSRDPQTRGVSLGLQRSSPAAGGM